MALALVHRVQCAIATEIACVDPRQGVDLAKFFSPTGNACGEVDYLARQA